MVYDQYCIVRSTAQGVVFGKVVSVTGQTVGVEDARQIHYWEGCNTLFEMARTGPGVARISQPVPYILMLEACGVIPCLPEAVENLKQSRWNESYVPSTSRPRASGRSRRTSSKTPD